jgi:hypothetical protein
MFPITGPNQKIFIWLTSLRQKVRQGGEEKTSKRKTRRNIGPQTNQPFEQDSKRRIGPYGGTGEPPIMQ